MMSGMNGGNCILTSIAKLRVEKGFIDGAIIVGKKSDYRVIFTGKAAEWKGENLTLSSARDPFTPKVFKTIDGAMADIVRIGLQTASVVVNTHDLP